MKQLLRLLLGLMPCFLFSCDYSPSGSHYEEVSPLPVVVADITLDNEQDTLFLSGDVNLRFNIQLPGRTVRGFRAELGGKEIATGPSFDGTLRLYTKNYSDGFHRMTLFIMGNSGTGSLADKSGAEFIEIYKTWTVHIDNSLTQGIALTSIKPEDGRLKLEWQPYKGTGFVKYDIIRKLDGYHSYDGVCASITDPAQTSWIDTDYVGGEASYTIALHVNGIDQGILGTPYRYSHPMPRVRNSAYNGIDALTVTISSTGFYNNFGKYELNVDGENIISTDWKDTVLTVLHPRFGGELEARLHTHPKLPSDYFSGPRTQAILPAYGTPWGPYEVQKLFSRPASGMFYFADYEQLKVIDAATLQVKQTRNISSKQHFGENQNVVSADGKYMYVILDYTLHRLDPLTLQTLATYALSDLVPAPASQLLSLHGCSNGNRLIIQALSESTDQHFAYVVDMDQKKVLLKKEVVDNENGASISYDGKTVQLIRDVYTETSNGSWQKLNIQEHDALTLKFHPTKPLFYTGYGPITFYNTNGSKYKTLNTEVALYQIQIEAGSGYLYGVGNKTLYVYNIDTGQLKRKLRLGNTVDAFVFKNRIYSQDRYIEL